jgi:Trk K+ transport system NAD-binding subunit
VTKAFSEIVVDEMPVVDNGTQKHLIGIIRKDDVIDAYNKAILKRDTVNSVFSYLNALQKFQRVEIANGQILCEIEVPGSFVKNSLQKLDLRNRFGIEVILIKQDYNPRKNEWEIVLTPRPDYHFKFGDAILIMGSAENIDKIKNLS